MAYLGLARKYRPKTFTELIGQEHVVTTLRHALSSGKFSHAYLFSGPRGTGKTTMARLLAMSLNCTNSKTPTTDPCGKCENCSAIIQGTSSGDVLEIDGASNRGIEQIRELRENAKYVPSMSRYRIYIIDEAHQITKDGFNALLKTLEEPPPHAIFMMATTEPYKMPATILSRCQRFHLTPLPNSTIASHLENLAAKESIKIEKAAIETLAKTVNGSLRDALSFLDQSAVHSPDGITLATTRNLLGLMPKDIVESLVSAIKTGDPVKILHGTDAAHKQGYDWTQTAKELQEYYHGLMLAKAGVAGSGEQNNEAGAYPWPVLVRNVRVLGRCLEEMRRSDSPKPIFEICCVELGQAVTDIGAIIKKLEHLDKPMDGVEEAKTSYETVTADSTPPCGEPAEPPCGELAEPESLIWNKITEKIQNERASLASALQSAKTEFVSPDKVILRFGSAFPMERVKKSIGYISQLYSQRCNRKAEIECVLDKNIPNELNDDPKDFENDPGIKKITAYFPGAILEAKRSRPLGREIS